MARRARMYLPGFTYHIVQRGNNREACFFEEDNYQVYLNLLEEVLPRYSVRLHAYCLMTNHVHLLVTPECSAGISSVAKVVGSRYAQYINKRYKRTGSLWEGRHKSSAVDSESYLLRCYRYIELNPVAAGMVVRPEEYKWSSYHSNAWGDSIGFISPHSEYLALGENGSVRTRAYRELFTIQLSDQDLHVFRAAASCSHPVGSDRFVKQIEAKSGAKLGSMRRGRPRKVVQN